METYCQRSVHFVAITITERFETRTVGGTGSNRRIAERKGESTALKPIPAPLLVAFGAMALALVRVPRLRALAGLASQNLLPHRGFRPRLTARSPQQRALPPP